MMGGIRGRKTRLMLGVPGIRYIRNGNAHHHSPKHLLNRS